MDSIPTVYKELNKGNFLRARVSCKCECCISDRYSLVLGSSTEVEIK